MKPDNLSGHVRTASPEFRTDNTPFRGCQVRYPVRAL